MPTSPLHPTVDSRVNYLLLNFGLVDRNPWLYTNIFDVSESRIDYLKVDYGRDDITSTSPGLSFSGATVRTFPRTYAGGLSFSGAFAQLKVLARSMTGGLSFVGAVVKSARRANTGGLSFSGAFVKSARRSVAGGLSFSGSQFRGTFKSFAGGLSFTGAYTKIIHVSKVLTGGLSFSGAVVKKAIESYSGGLSFSGAVTRNPRRLLSGGLSFSGAASRLTSRAIAGGLSFSGAAAKSAILSVAGGLSFSGAITRRAAKVLRGFLDFINRNLGRVDLLWLDYGIIDDAGADRLSKGRGKSYPGVLSFSGAFVKAGNKAFSGGLSFTGSAYRRAIRAFAGALSFSGAITPLGKKVFAAGLSFAGAIVKYSAKSYAGVLSFSGASTRGISRAFAGTLSFSGGISRRIAKLMTGFLDFVMRNVGKVDYLWLDYGTVDSNGPDRLTRNQGRSHAGTLSFSGAVSKFSSKVFSGALSFSGIISKGTAFLVSLNAALSFTGTVLRAGRRAFTASIDFIERAVGKIDYLLIDYDNIEGVATIRLLKSQARAYTASVSFAGQFAKRAQKTFGGGLSFAGSFVRLVPKVFTATIDFLQAGLGLVDYLNIDYGFLNNGFPDRLQKVPRKTLSAVVSFSGASTSRAGKAFQGVLDFTGSITRGTFRGFASVLSFSGAISNRAVAHIMTAALSFVGAMTLIQGRVMSGSLSFSGLMGSLYRWPAGRLRYFANTLWKAHWGGVKIALRDPIKFANIPKAERIDQEHKPIQIKAVYPQVSYKLGTDVMFEVSFVDKDGALYDPDVNTVKIYCKKPDINGVSQGYLTGYDPATGGKLMTKMSTGVYQTDVQFLRTDPSGVYTVEAEGKVGTKTTIDDVRVSLRI